MGKKKHEIPALSYHKSARVLLLRELTCYLLVIYESKIRYNRFLIDKTVIISDIDINKSKYKQIEREKNARSKLIEQLSSRESHRRVFGTHFQARLDIFVRHERKSAYKL